SPGRPLCLAGVTARVSAALFLAFALRLPRRAMRLALGWPPARALGSLSPAVVALLFSLFCRVAVVE
ncbi:hypothetical protein KI387_013489, partial [Taxus chinensis]